MKFFLKLLFLVMFGSLFWPFLENIFTKEEQVELVTKPKEEIKEEIKEIPQEISPYYSKTTFFKKEMTFYGVLKKEALQGKSILALIKKAKPLINLAKIPLKSKIEFTKKTSDDALIQIRLILPDGHGFLFKKEKKSWLVLKQDPDWSITRKAYTGLVTQSLWKAFSEQGLDDKVIHKFIKIFAWQVDFARQTRRGDTWKILVEEKTRKGVFLGWRNIVYAEYKKQKKTPYHAVRFSEKGKKARYFSLKGDNLAGLFLKSPVNFTRISSTFQKKRFHPILKKSRPHYGIDYAAARGTPVYAVGDGVIKRLGYSRGSGNYIVIKHNKIYETAYRHLHGFAKKIKKNKRVKQGEVIGYVGSTGLATGPHLHFEFHKNKRHVDPLSTKFPRASSVASSQKEEFRKTVFACQEEFNLLTQKSNEF